MKMVGIILIVIGVAALALQGINYTTKEKIIDLGPVEASAENEHRIPLPPILGGVALAGGVVLMIAGARKP
jgi:uncharacterized membrane protein YidH (DUF202 family)